MIEAGQSGTGALRGEALGHPSVRQAGATAPVERVADGRTHAVSGAGRQVPAGWRLLPSVLEEDGGWRTSFTPDGAVVGHGAVDAREHGYGRVLLRAESGPAGAVLEVFVRSEQDRVELPPLALLDVPAGAALVGMEDHGDGMRGIAVVTAADAGREVAVSCDADEVAVSWEPGEEPGRARVLLSAVLPAEAWADDAEPGTGEPGGEPGGEPCGGPVDDAGPARVRSMRVRLDTL